MVFAGLWEAAGKLKGFGSLEGSTVGGVEPWCGRVLLGWLLSLLLGSCQGPGGQLLVLHSQ